MANEQTCPHQQEPLLKHRARWHTGIADHLESSLRRAAGLADLLMQVAQESSIHGIDFSPESVSKALEMLTLEINDALDLLDNYQREEQRTERLAASILSKVEADRAARQGGEQP